jgi:superfamily II RNA helicase
MQMAGRAGRRTKDKRGNVWNIITRKYPATLVKKFAVSNRIDI